MMHRYLTAEKARKMSEKAAVKARNNCYHEIISRIENGIKTCINDGRYTYHTSFNKSRWMNDHMVDCLKKHFRARGFLVEVKFVENNNDFDDYDHYYDYYRFSISWDV